MTTTTSPITPATTADLVARLLPRNFRRLTMPPEAQRDASSPGIGAAGQTVAAMRAGLAAMMATMIASDQIRTTTVTLGARPALLVEPTDGVRPGTILYFHGGNVFGSHLLGNELQFLEADEGVIAYGPVGSGSAHLVALNLADTTRPTPSSGTIVAATQPLAQGAPSPDTLEPGAGFVVSVAGDAQQLPDTNRKVHAPARPPIGTALQGYDGRGQRAS